MKGAAQLPRIAVVGASSLIGEAVLEEILSRKIGFAALHAVDDERQIGRSVLASASHSQAAGDLPTGAADRDQPLQVIPVTGFDFSTVDLAFFCGRSQLAERHAEAAAAHGWVIDCSSAFRARSDVPLIAADVNGSALAGFGSRGLIALPGSASVALATALAPLHARAGLERVDVVTYHAVSGSGRGAMEELAAETVALLSGKKARGRGFGRQIAFNVIPQVDALQADGVSREELRLWQETRRVLGLPRLAINATAVRVPVFFGHSLAIHAAFERPLTAAQASQALQAAPGIAVISPDSSSEYPTPAIFATAPDKVYIGRLRADPTRDRALNFWVVADNVRKCAAYNAVSVAQILVNTNPVRYSS